MQFIRIPMSFVQCGEVVNFRPRNITLGWSKTIFFLFSVYQFLATELCSFIIRPHTWNSKIRTYFLQVSISLHVLIYFIVLLISFRSFRFLYFYSMKDSSPLCLFLPVIFPFLLYVHSFPFSFGLHYDFL